MLVADHVRSLTRKVAPLCTNCTARTASAVCGTKVMSSSAPPPVRDSGGRASEPAVRWPRARPSCRSRRRQPRAVRSRVTWVAMIARTSARRETAARCDAPYLFVFRAVDDEDAIDDRAQCLRARAAVARRSRHRPRVQRAHLRAVPRRRSAGAGRSRVASARAASAKTSRRRRGAIDLAVGPQMNRRRTPRGSPRMPGSPDADRRCASCVGVDNLDAKCRECVGDRRLAAADAAGQADDVAPSINPGR